MEERRDEESTYREARQISSMHIKARGRDDVATENRGEMNMVRMIALRNRSPGKRGRKGVRSLREVKRGVASERLVLGE